VSFSRVSAAAGGRSAAAAAPGVPAGWQSGRLRAAGATRLPAFAWTRAPAPGGQGRVRGANEREAAPALAGREVLPNADVVVVAW